MILEITESIGLEVSEVSDVILVLELIAERKSVESYLTRGLILVLVTGNVVFIKLVIRCTLPSPC